MYIDRNICIVHIIDELEISMYVLCVHYSVIDKHTALCMSLHGV